MAKLTRYKLVPVVLVDALRRIARATGFAVMTVIADAKDNEAQSFYTRFGFLPLQGKKGNRLFTPFESIKDL